MLGAVAVGFIYLCFAIGYAYKAFEDSQVQAMASGAPPANWMPLLVVLAMAAVFGTVGKLAGDRKGRPYTGVAFGLAIGPIGWLLTLCLPDINRKCPACFGSVPDEATRCRHCGQPIEPAIYEVPAPESKRFIDVHAPVGAYEPSQVEVCCPACSKAYLVPDCAMDQGIKCECGVGFVPGAKPKAAAAR